MKNPVNELYEFIRKLSADAELQGYTVTTSQDWPIQLVTDPVTGKSGMKRTSPLTITLTVKVPPHLATKFQDTEE